MNNHQLAEAILGAVGAENISEAYNCMTRLRLHVSQASVSKEDLKKIEGIKGVIQKDDEIQIVLGPGKAENVTKEFQQLLLQKSTHSSNNAIAAGTDSLNNKESAATITNSLSGTAAKNENITVSQEKIIGDGKELHEAIKEKNSRSAFKRLLRRIGHIFIPLIPAFIGCGLLTGIVSLLGRFSPELAGEPLLQYLKLTGGSVFMVLNAFVGLYACKEFGGTPALGGAMAALLAAPGLADIHLLGSALIPGRGGVFASLLAGSAAALIETRLVKRIPEAASLFLTPFITILIVSLSSIFIFQPLGGFLSDTLNYYTVRSIQSGGAVTGFIIGGIFLPVVMAGVHHGLTPIHADMLASMGMTILLPIAAMAGCGQVGASFAVYLKSKNKELKRTVLSALPVGIMGIGEPLIYGVTLPLGRPFIGACVGGAFGGAWQACHGIGAYTLGISGLTLAPATNNILVYLIGVLIAYLAGFIATWLAGFDDPPEENLLQ